jgi:hypothetical protein
VLRSRVVCQQLADLPQLLENLIRLLACNALILSLSLCVGRLSIRDGSNEK